MVDYVWQKEHLIEAVQIKASVTHQLIFIVAMSVLAHILIHFAGVRFTGNDYNSKLNF